MPRKPASRYAAATVFALLVLATVAAFAWSQKQKREPLVLDKVTIGIDGKNSFTPNGDCRFDHIRIRFRTTISDDGTVQIIRPSGAKMITLARDEFLKRYRFHTFFWDGRRAGGGIAPPGRYKLRVKLLGEDRVLVPAGTIKLHKGTTDKGSACDAGGPGGVAPNAAEPAP
ncbi:MAG TPA: hypothetical protein VFB52_05645 [Solirubrobacterales bacterium]|nr:hypothetical protein [Solirubrobacterales bacterium]